jgi:hypothetical protein
VGVVDAVVAEDDVTFVIDVDGAVEAVAAVIAVVAVVVAVVVVVVEVLVLTNV